MPETTIDELLQSYSPEVQQLARGACELVASLLPGATVKAHSGWKNIIFGTGPKMGDMVVAIAPLASRINFQLFGADLPDPAGLLEGTGKGGRHIKISTREQLKSPAVRDLLLAAIAAKGTPAAERAANSAPPASGHRAYASKTVAVPVEALFAAWTDDDARRAWLGDHPVTLRGTTPNKSLRARWGEMPMDVRFESKGDARSSVNVDHRGIATEAEAAEIKALWKAAFTRLDEQLRR